MGGITQIFKAPKQSVLQAPAPRPQSRIDPAAQAAAQAAAARTDMLEVRRRGRAGTVRTSQRGLVQLAADAPQKKSLLGE